MLLRGDIINDAVVSVAEVGAGSSCREPACTCREPASAAVKLPAAAVKSPALGPACNAWLHRLRPTDSARAHTVLDRSPCRRLPPPLLGDHGQARTLLQLVRAFYTDPSAHRLVYTFNHEPEKFNFDALLAELGLSPEGQRGSSGGSSGSGSSSGSSGSRSGSSSGGGTA